MPSVFPELQPLVIKQNPFVFVKPKVGSDEIQGAVVAPDTKYMCNTYTNRPTQMVSRHPGGTAVRSGDGNGKIYKFSVLKPF